MKKIWLPDNSRAQVGGGWRFLENFRKGAERAGFEVTGDFRGADGGIVAGPTIVDPGAVLEARRYGLPLVFRVDNVPRKSRNRRNTPHERMREIVGMCDAVVYQSEWAARYCAPLCGEGTVIYNGTDLSVFSPAKEKPAVERWLWAYHGRGNDMKGFWEAHLRFQLRARENPAAEFWFVADFGRETETLRAANFDFWNGEKWEWTPVPVRTPEEMVTIMRQCTHLIYPAVGDACPNVVIEALCCGLEVVGYPGKELAGTAELVELHKRGFDWGAERMAREYAAVLELARQSR